MKNFKKYIETIASVNEKDWSVFSSLLKKREISKKSTFLVKGEIEDNISFIEKGEVRLFMPEAEQEKELTFGFSFQGEFISAYDSFLTRTPSIYQLEALADTILGASPTANYKKYTKTTSIGNTVGRFISEKLFLIKSKREQSLLNETSEQRYLNLFKDRPNVNVYINVINRL